MATCGTSIQFFEFKYETAPEIPPPYCYYYQVKGRMEKESLALELEWVYHHREDISLEEITDEGFTGNDNISWKGNLDLLWAEELERLVIQTQANPNVSEEAPFMEVIMKGYNENIFNGSPLNIDEWDYFMQEFIQGIFEAAGKEAPLQIQFKKIYPDKTFFKLILTLFFKTRTVQIQTVTSHTQKDQTTQNWEQAKSLLKDIYSLYYLPENGVYNEPKEAGSFIDIGEGIWYEFTHDVVNPHKNSNALAKLEKYFLLFNK